MGSKLVFKGKTDFLCTLRGYLNYISITDIYYSYILQALYRYWHIKRITRFDSIGFRILFIVILRIVQIVIALILCRGTNQFNSFTMAQMIILISYTPPVENRLIEVKNKMLSKSQSNHTNR